MLPQKNGSRIDFPAQCFQLSLKVQYSIMYGVVVWHEAALPILSGPVFPRDGVAKSSRGNFLDIVHFPDRAVVPPHAGTAPKTWEVSTPPGFNASRRLDQGFKIKNKIQN